MGNCTFKGHDEAGPGGCSAIIRVATCNGGIMELLPPVTAECITNEFPGHAIYRSSDGLAMQLLHNEELAGGELYYLRPVNSSIATVIPSAPYRVSLEQHGLWKRQESNLEVEPNLGGSGCGMWKVKLVISPERLAEILSQETQTEALIESVRTVAKCGNGSAAVSSMESSDLWSLVSSRKAGSEII